MQLRHGTVQERLSAKARLDCHHKDEIAQRQERQHGLCRGVRFDGNGSAHTVFPDAAQGLERVFLRVGLNMEREDAASGLTERVNIADGPLDHQMDIQRQGGDARNGSDDRDADGDIRNKHAVHDVDVDIIGSCGGQRADISLQIDKIRGQNGRCDLDHSVNNLHAVLPEPLLFIIANFPGLSI